MRLLPKPYGSNGILRGVKRSAFTKAEFELLLSPTGQKKSLLELNRIFSLHTSTSWQPPPRLPKLKIPIKSDGISILPTLLGKPQKVKHDFIYFEIYEGPFQQSVRVGDWKGYRRGLKDPVELYDLSKDPSEKKQHR